jgi:hypothetical protein
LGASPSTPSLVDKGGAYPRTASGQLFSALEPR